MRGCDWHMDGAASNTAIRSTDRSTITVFKLFVGVLGDGPSHIQRECGFRHADRAECQLLQMRSRSTWWDSSMTRTVSGSVSGGDWAVRVNGGTAMVKIVVRDGVYGWLVRANSPTGGVL